MKKQFFSIALILIMLLSAGCSSVNIPLTEQESDAIAQYSAYLLLKYDNNKNSTEKLLDLDDLNDLKEEKLAAEATPTPTVTPTPTPTPEPTVEPEPTAADKGEDDASVDISPTSAVPGSDTTDPIPDKKDDVKYAESVSELFGKDFEVSYKSFVLSDEYVENDYFTVNAPDNKKILSVNFEIKNSSSSEKLFESKNRNLVYTLYTDDRSYIAPEISMLGNDIQFLNDKIKGNSSFNAVLLFYVNENRKSFKLRITNTDSGKVFDIKIN